MTVYPNIEFRDGPSGRRAALIGGPDLWELIATFKHGSARHELSVSETAELLGLSEFQVRSGMSYYREHPNGIDERIKRNVKEADTAEAVWCLGQSSSG